MILTDREIQIAIENKQIIVERFKGASYISSTSLDLTLSDKIKIWNSQSIIVTPAALDFNYTEFARSHQRQIGIDSEQGYNFKPSSFILASTEEFIELPYQSRIAARVEGKSSLARLGIGVHITAPTIHAGFKGTITLEMFNFGPLTVQLIPGMKICQLIFEQTSGTPNRGYSGHFSGQSSAF